MDQPARRLDDEENQAVYDEPTGTAPSDPREHLKVLEGGGETTAPKRGHLKDASETKSSSADDLGLRENPVGNGYKPDAAHELSKIRPNIRSVLNFAKTNRGKVALGGAAVGFITLIIMGFLALIPFKIMHIVTNLQNKFYATSENAVQRETDALFSQYVKKYVLPASRKCGSSITKDCNPIPASTNPVSRLYKGWQNAKLEEKLKTNYGIEFSYDKNSGTYKMRAPGLGSGGVNIDEFANSSETLDEFIAKSNNSAFKTVNRSQIRQTVRDSLQNETLWKRVMYRFKVGRLLEEKYGIKRCIIFCNSKDALADSIQAQKNAARLYVVERVIQPRDATLAVVLKCFLDTNCDPTNTTSVPCEEGVNCELNNVPENPETDTEIRQSLDDLATKYGIKGSEELTALYEQVEKDGINKFVVKYVMDKVFGVAVSDATAESLSKAIPIIGWLNLAFQAAGFADKGPAKLKKLSYLTNAPAAISMYSMYRTYTDEIKSGKVNATEVGSFVDSLGPVAKNANLVDLKGGTAQAEQTPLYNSIINNGVSGGTSDFKCDDGKSPPGGAGANLICPEEKLAVDNSYLDSLKTVVDSTGLGQMANIWNESVGKLLGILGSSLSFIVSVFAKTVDTVYCHKLPIVGYNWSPMGVYCDARDIISAATNKIINFLTSQLFPSPFSENMSGGRTFDMIAAGADASGNEYAHTGLGGQKLSDQQVASITSEQRQQSLEEYKNESIFARIFNTQNEYSPVTKLAMSMPTSSIDFSTKLGGLFSNPFGLISNGFGSIFTPARSLATAPQIDPFGVPQYGFAVDDPGLAEANQDPVAYWDKYCADGSLTQQWNSSAAQPENVDPINGMPSNAQTDPCLLIQATVGSTGGIYDSSLLTPDDLSGGAGVSTGTTPSANQSFYFVGDSLTVGMDTSGGLEQKLTANGDSVTKVEATVGDSVSAALPKVKADQSKIAAAGTIVVALGTNDGINTSASTFTPRIQAMISQIKAYNPNAKIFWVNAYADDNHNDYSGVNQAINTLASSLGYTVIDWHSEALSNNSTYAPFAGIPGPPLVHPTQHYSNMADFIIHAIGGS